MTINRAVLAAVPHEHLASGKELAAKTGKVQFGTENPEPFLHLRSGDPVYIFASGQGGVPKVSWQADYVGVVAAGSRTEPSPHRPATTDSDGRWSTFWEVTNLHELESSFAVALLSRYDSGLKLAKTFVPHGPIPVRSID